MIPSRTSGEKSGSSLPINSLFILSGSRVWRTTYKINRELSRYIGINQSNTHILITKTSFGELSEMIIGEDIIPELAASQDKQLTTIILRTQKDPLYLWGRQSIGSRKYFFEEKVFIRDLVKDALHNQGHLFFDMTRELNPDMWVYSKNEGYHRRN